MQRSATGPQVERAVRVATACAFMLVAHQVAAKAVRDTLFLTQFDVTRLPRLVVAASLLSIVTVLAASRALARGGPERLLPAACCLSAALQLAFAALNPTAPRFVAVAMYLHVAVFGAILISWFWSLLSEGLDPNTARRRVGMIAAGGTLGGLLGGVVAERVASAFSTATMLPTLAGLHLVCAGLVWFTTGALGQRAAPAAEEPTRSGFDVLREVPYLRALGAFVMVGTIAATVLDYVFKERASAAFEGDDLLRCFAIFYTATGLGAFLLQTLLTKRLLARGIAPTAATLPTMVSLGAATLLFLPGFFAASVVRGIEAAVRSSLFRSSYELFYAPVRRADKRAAKTILDVGFDRLGDAFGGGLIQLVLVIAAATGVASSRGASAALLAIGIVLGLAGLLLARSLDRGYTRALEARLLEHEMPSSSGLRSSIETQSTFLPMLTQLELTPLGTEAHRDELAEASAPAASDDPEERTLAELSSGDANRVRRALVTLDDPSPRITEVLIRLLAWDAVSTDVAQVLQDVGRRRPEPLAQALLDPNEEFATRRRLARVLATSTSPVAIHALLGALRDARFEVRFRAGAALARLHLANANLAVDPDAVFAAIRREATVNRHVWESNRLLDEVGRDESPFYDEVLRTRSSRSLEHVFNMFSLVYPPEPLRIAYRGLHASDRSLRGTALEYLEQVLPSEIRQLLWPFLDDDRVARRSARSPDDVMESLLRSHLSIQMDLKRLTERPTDPDSEAQ
jgi:hypothetical protein